MPTGTVRSELRLAFQSGWNSNRSVASGVPVTAIQPLWSVMRACISVTLPRSFQMSLIDATHFGFEAVGLDVAEVEIDRHQSAARPDRQRVLADEVGVVVVVDRAATRANGRRPRSNLPPISYVHTVSPSYVENCGGTLAALKPPPR